MPIRLHEYSTEIMASAMEENKYKSIPSVIPIVLYTGKTKWKIENEKQLCRYDMQSIFNFQLSTI